MSERIAASIRIGIFSLCLAAVIAGIGGVASAPAARAATNLDVHVHDNYYHPAGAFLVGPSTDHVAAKAACQGATPAAACDALIHVGDTITWVVAPPLAAFSHTVTECTDNTFTVCGAAVDAVNPINDSGVRPPASGWPYGPIQFNSAGTFYYRCEIHPNTMRGRIIVQDVPVTVGGSGAFADPAAIGGTAAGGGSALVTAAVASAVAAVVMLSGLAGAAVLVRARWRDEQ